jgi:hypothetical protein
MNYKYFKFNYISKMKIKIKFYSVLFILLSVFLLKTAFSQNDEDIWKKWNYLIGTWKGVGEGKPGEGEGYFTFEKDLDSKILIRKSHSVYPASNNKPQTIHDDIMIIYLDSKLKPFNAIYFDNENHVINYTINYDDVNSGIEFISEPVDNSPRFRLTYIKVDDNYLKIKFEFAPPDKPELFSTYLEGKAYKEK